MEKFLASRQVQGISDRTFQGYKSYFKPFVARFSDLPQDPEFIDDFLGSIKGDPETRWGYRKCLVALYHFIERRYPIHNPMPDAAQVKIPRKRRRVLSEDELARLFEYVDDFRERAILTLLIDSKIRASELCSLTREKIYPDHITVKGKTGERDVPISGRTYDMLIQLAASSYLFPSIKFSDQPMRREYLRIMVSRLMERSGLNGKKLGPHIIRHSTSVAHIMHGGDLLSLKEELGHTTTKMTERYAQLAFKDVKQKHSEVNILGRIAPEPVIQRAICFACDKEISLDISQVKTKKCPGCGQVGNWYLPDHRAEGVKSEPAHSGWYSL